MVVHKFIASLGQLETNANIQRGVQPLSELRRERPTTGESCGGVHPKRAENKESGIIKALFSYAH